MSLYDESVVGLLPWRDSGYQCFSYSNKHPLGMNWLHGVWCIHADLEDADTKQSILRAHGGDVAFAYAAPPCRDLCRVGMRWWKRKAEQKPDFQVDAIRRVKDAYALLRAMQAPFFVIGSANSVLDRRWRRCDATFQPHEFGAYLAATTPHPLHALVVPARDAYTQRQALWTGGGFGIPTRRPVPPIYKLVKKRGGVTCRISPIGLWKARAARRGVPHGFATAVHARMGLPRLEM